MYISRLRGKLEPRGIGLRSIRGFGYRPELINASPRDLGDLTLQPMQLATMSSGLQRRLLLLLLLLLSKRVGNTH